MSETIKWFLVKNKKTTKGWISQMCCRWLGPQWKASPEIKDISSPLTIIRYIVLHSGTIGTIEYQENSIWRQSRLDLQRSVFRTMTYTIWALQIFYLMKRKRKEDPQVNLWDFSRQSDDLMSEFWFAFNKLLNLHLTPRIFFSEKDLRTNLFPSKNISVARVWPFQS